MDWKKRITEIGVLTKNDDEQGLKGTLKALHHADVLWTAWSDDGETAKIRVIRGRELDGPGLKHGVILVANEISALEFAESYGDQIDVKADGKTLDVPKLAVPKHLIAMIKKDPVRIHDGTTMDWNWNGAYDAEEV